MKEDRRIALAAFAYDHVKLEDSPERWKNNRYFFLHAVKKQSSCWFNLPLEYSEDPLFVRVFSSFASDKLVEEVFSVIPSLRTDRSIWETIIGSDGCTLEHAPALILSDQELMIKAVSRDVNYIKVIDESLILDHDFMQQVIDMDAAALILLPKRTQRQMVDLYLSNLPKLIRRMQDFPNYYRQERLALIAIARQVRSLPAFVKTWFTSGPGFHERVFPESMKDDEQIFLWISEHGNYAETVVDSFNHVSDRLKGDQTFMEKAIEHTPHLFITCASEELQGDMNLCARALSSCNDVDTVDDPAFLLFARYFDRWLRNADGRSRQQKYRDTFAFLKGKVNAYESFVTLILLCIALPGESHLNMLNQGHETSLAYKKLICVFAGVPTGSELWMYRNALKNLLLFEQSVNAQG